MKYSFFFVVSLVCFQLQAAPEHKKSHNHKVEKSDHALIKKVHYSSMANFAQSIEEGRNHVEEYVTTRPKLLTKVEKVSGLTPLEIAVVADNECAVKSILAAAFENDKKLAISMAIDKASKAGNTHLVNILKFSCIEDEDAL
ncbi:hypothetical protein [Candidatus Chromulinivorax destructor]|uniref:Ankyrin repeat domain-containing protein n=1 Tax=Candidatus Chromulinivorax destructor TaxID=2066483 RepID=A0A345ZCQ3_9BACT|nr:hypothetical protein [Candidatus Chromulinivorax destructor]AXK61070.1 hypothetical protein C0J27_05050 [Candidatus Chromulinivorax destructor]